MADPPIRHTRLQRRPAPLVGQRGVVHHGIQYIVENEVRPYDLACTRIHPISTTQGFKYASALPHSSLAIPLTWAAGALQQRRRPELAAYLDTKLLRLEGHDLARHSHGT